MNSILVEANILYTSGECKAKRLKRLQVPRNERYQLYLTYDAAHQGFTFKSLIVHIASIGGPTSSFTPNPIGAYIYGVTPWDEDSLGMPLRHNWTQYRGVPQKSVEMSRRLTKILNTFWDASRWPLAITRNDPFADVSMNTITGEPNSGLTMSKTEAIFTRQVLIYKADVEWVVSLVICSIILLILGLVSFLLSLRTTAPDIFD